MSRAGFDPLHDFEAVSSPPHAAARVDLDAEMALDLELAARSLVNVMVTAEDAARRTASARTIHARSGRRERPFVARCGLPPAGEDHGVSTCDLDDWFVRAAGGTLFIDHIGQLSAHAQAVLLFRLTDGLYRGGAAAMPGSDRRVRVIVGSDRPLNGDLATGAFSEELFYRLNMIHIDRLHAHDT